MSKRSTRSNFLKTTGWVMAASVLQKDEGSRLPVAESAPLAGEIARWVTSGRLRYASAAPLTWRTRSAPDNSIAVDPSKMFQKRLGFGAAFTDAPCYSFNQVPSPAREQLFHERLHPSEMGLNVCHTCSGASDSLDRSLQL